MTDSTMHDDLDIRAQLARIDRDMAETHKLLAEQGKLTAEQQKLGAEQNKFTAEQVKLFAEGAKFNRDRWLIPLVAIIGPLLGVIVGTMLK
jgi:hypothetical protein